MQENPFNEKVVLITGAARRIGAEIAQCLHAAGMNVVLHYYQSEAEAMTLCDRLNSQREQSAVALKADLNDIDSTNQLIEKAVSVWQRLDALVNNASRFYRTLLSSPNELAWDDLMTSNVKSPFFLSQSAAPYLAKQHGAIINITDIHAETPLRDYGIYCISKSGLLMMTRLLAKELGPEVRVNAVAPGAILWPEGENTMTAQEKDKVIASTLLKKEGHPRDIAKAVLFFIRDAAYITGQVLNVDGGRSVG